MFEILTSPEAVKIEIRVRGIPAKNKPNVHRPFYRKTKVIMPLVFWSNGRIICHPSIAPQVEAAIRDAVKEAKERISSGIEQSFLYGSSPIQYGISPVEKAFKEMAYLKDAIKAVDSMYRLPCRLF
jgi:hypothetical protein